MKRRTFSHFPKSETATVAPTPVNGDLSPYNGEWSKFQIIHLSRRLLFGAKLEDIAHFENLSFEQAIEELLTPSPKPSVPVNNYNDGEYTDPEVPFGEPWINAAYDNEAEGRRIWSLKGWWLGNMIEQEHSIMEKMILFWFNHIPIKFYDVFRGKWDYDYIELLRTHALGNFKEMMRAITLDPAMLHFLNGQYNDKSAPDENYSRELQELFCIGKGPDANYTEGDVQAAARILTGWRVNYSTNRTFFAANRHDNDDKVFSEFYGNRIIKKTPGRNGSQELDELLDMIFDNQECALFICRKLYRFFVHHNIDEWAEEMIIVPLAAIFRDNNYEILPVLQTLFSSQHFFDQFRKGALVKSPLDFIVSLYRDFNTPIPAKNLLRNRYEHNGHVVYQSYLFDQDIGDPPNVAGWPAYYQIPNFDKSWINTNTLPRRAAFTDWILWAGISTDNFIAQLNLLDTVAQIPEADDPNKLVDFMIEWQYTTPLSASFRQRLKAILLSGQVNDYYWTDAWVRYLNNPNNEMRRETVLNRLKPFFYTLLHQEEYHLV